MCSSDCESSLQKKTSVGPKSGPAITFSLIINECIDMHFARQHIVPITHIFLTKAEFYLYKILCL